MEFDTLDGQKFNTDAMTDMQAEVIEGVMKAPVFDRLKNSGGAYFTFVQLPKQKSFVHLHLPEGDSMNSLLGQVKRTVEQASGGRYTLVLVNPNTIKPE
jgi:hypothetical protein